MITSVSKAELYGIIFGYNDAAHNPYIISTKVTAEIGTPTAAGPVNWKTFGETQKPSESIKAANVDTFTRSGDFKVDHGNVSGLTFKRNTDRLEISDEVRNELEACKDIEPYELSDVIYFIGNDRFKVHIDSGMPNGIPTEERIAEVYGNMAKRLDAAYSEGMFSKEEYDELNKMIADGMEWETTCAENNKASRAIGQKRANLPYKMTALSHIIRECIMSPEQRRAKMQAEISVYVNKYFKYDRRAILQMFNSVRYGK